MYKKVYSIVLFLAFVIIFLCMVKFYDNIFQTHQSIIKHSEAYEENHITSDDERYILNTQKIEESNVTYITFCIVKAENGKIVFDCPDKFRTYDLKSISWDSQDVVVKSSDIGTVKYIYVDGNWKK